MSQEKPAPAFDSRPLPSELLIPEELEILVGLQERLGVIADNIPDNSEGSRSTSTCSGSAWARTDATRSPNVLFIDGKRGTGKTSLMLTLIRAWEEEVCGADRLSKDPALDAIWRRGSVLSRLRVLPIVDFQPLPAGIPIYAWLMETFREICRQLDDIPGARSMDPCSGYHAASRNGASMEGLADQLVHIQRCAIEAWNLAEGVKARDKEDWLLDMAAQASDWRGLPERWQAFISALCEAIEKRETGGKKVLLLVPIDDLDLQVRQVRELLLAFRLLRHPQLAFLVTGDIPHLLGGVALAIGRDFQHGLTSADDAEHWWRAAVAGSDGATSSDCDLAVGRLARELAVKIIPPVHRWEMPHPTIEQALTLVHSTLELEQPTLGQGFKSIEIRLAPEAARLRAALRELESDSTPEATSFTLLDLVEQLIEGATALGKGTLFSFRQVTQLAEFVQEESRTARIARSPERPVELLRVLRTWYELAPDPRLGVEFYSHSASLDSIDAPVLRSVSTSAKTVAKGRLSSTSIPGAQGRRVSVVVPTIDDFAFELPAEGGLEDTVTMHRAPLPLVLAIDANEEARPNFSLRGLVPKGLGHESRVRILHLDLGFWIPWPGVRLESPSGALAEVELLVKIGAVGDGGEWTIDEFAWRWLAYQFMLHGLRLPRTFPSPLTPSTDSLATTTEDGTGIEEAAPPLSALIELLTFAPSPDRNGREALEKLERWRQESLLLLGMPEYGLSAVAQWAVLRTCLPTGPDGQVELSTGRKNAIMAARRRALASGGSAPGFSVDDLISTIESDSSGLPWWCITRRQAKGASWWLNLVTPVCHQREQSSIERLVIGRSYGATGLRHTRPSDALFWIPTAQGMPGFPHALTLAMDRLLVATWGESNGTPATHSLAMKLASTVPHGTGGVALILKALFEWICDLSMEHGSWNADLARRMQDVVILSEDNIILRGEGWALTMGSSGSFSVAGLTIPRYGRWRILGEGDRPRTLGEPWYEASIALRGVIQSFMVDSSTDEEAANIAIELTDKIRSESGPLEFPPLRAWLDHELLLRVMDRACEEMANRSQLTGHASPIRRWLLALFIDCCTKLVNGDRALLSPDASWPFRIQYPVDDLDTIRSLCTDLARVAREETVAAPTRLWAQRALQSYAEAFDDAAAFRWSETLRRVLSAPPGHERVMMLLNEGQAMHLIRADIHGVGKGIAAAIVAVRNEGGPFRDIAHMRGRVNMVGSRVETALHALADRYDEHPELDPLT